MMYQTPVKSIESSVLVAAICLLSVVPPVSLGAEPKWRDLCDGKTLAGWKVTNFGGEGDVNVENGTIEMDFGSSLTGITYTKELPKTNYELQLEAKRVDGIDFFCATTFPVQNSFCTLIVGGWAGSVVGLSNIDDEDASQNASTRFMTFRNDQWYKIRLRVTKERIAAWIDEKKVVDQSIAGKKIDIRPEVELSRPLGIAAWESRAALRNIRLRTLGDPEKRVDGASSER